MTSPTKGSTGRVRPRTVEEADAQFSLRQRDLLRGWGQRWRSQTARQLPPWNPEAPTALRMIAAGMEVLGKAGADPNARPEDFALFSGLTPTFSLAAHQAEFREAVGAYFAGVSPYTEIGTDTPGKPEDAHGDRGDYDFPLRDVIWLIHRFVDEPEVLTNDMIVDLICQQQVEFTPAGDGWTASGEVPFAGQDLEKWVCEGPGGRHWFALEIPVVSDFPLDIILGALPDPSLKVGTPETENHMLGIFAWRFLVNEYLTWVSRLQPGDPFDHRIDGRLKALVDADPDRYVNGEGIIDLVLQLLGRIPHAGMYESNAKPYGAYAISPLLAFHDGTVRLFPDDPVRERIRVAACNALDYLAAEFAVQSLEGKRIAPFRRNVGHKEEAAFYKSDYAPHIWGVLTGAYVFPDGEDGPYHGTRIDQEGGFALWAALSTYRVPRAVHDLMLNKHGGFAARVQTRYSKTSYPLEITVGHGGPGPLGNPPDPALRPARYFQDIAFEPPEWGVPGPGEFVPTTQLYFATPDYLNSAGGHNLSYYFEYDVSQTLVDVMLAFAVGLPPIPGIRDLAHSLLNDLLNALLEKQLRGSDVFSRPSTLIPRGHLDPDGSIEALEAVLPAMRGQDDFWASKNVSTYKSLGLGYTFRPGGHDRHLVWPQRYPAAWNEHVAERFGIGRAAFQVFDFVHVPDHPLAGHYWVIAQFSKSENRGQFREYGRGLWEVVPGHQAPDARTLADRIRKLNPGSHFDDDPDHHYTYRMATTGETLVIHNRFGSTATEQAILELRSAAGEPMPLNRHLADMRDLEKLREIPLLDAWQVDRDHAFTGLKYAHADGHGRVVLHNPFVGQTVRIDSSNYKEPTRSVDDVGVSGLELPPAPDTAGLLPAVSGLALGAQRLYAIQYGFQAGQITPSPKPGELLALDPITLQVQGRAPLGHAPRGVTVDRSTETVYAVNYDEHSLTAVDGNSMAVAYTLRFDGFGVHDLAVSETFHRVFVPQAGQQRVIVVDGPDGQEIKPMTDLPVVGTVALDPDTDRMFLALRNPQDPAKQDIVEYAVDSDGQHEVGRVTVSGQVSVPSGLGVDAAYCYVLAFAPRPDGAPGQKLVIIDRATRQVVREVSLPTGVALAVAGSASQRMACISTNVGIIVVDTHTGARLRKTDYEGKMLGSVVVDEATGIAWFAGSHSRLVRYFTRAFDLGE